jgi:ubiquitin-conjugating enzyme E2 D/E
MSTNGMRRLSLEFKKIHKNIKKNEKENKESEYRVWLVNDNMKHWKAKIRGPPDTPFEGGIYLLNLKFPDNYPFSPPKISFNTRMYHPNVSDSGTICLDVLKNGKWSPAMRVDTALRSVISFLNDPNPSDPLTTSAATVYKKDRQEYDNNIRSYRDKYCCKKWNTDK